MHVGQSERYNHLILSPDKTMIRSLKLPIIICLIYSFCISMGGGNCAPPVNTQSEQSDLHIATQQLQTKAPCIRQQLPAPGKDLISVSGPESQPTSVARFNLPTVTYEVAQQLGVLQIIDRLNRIKAQPEHDLYLEVERLKLKNTLDSKVTIATLQVRDVTAKIERELALFNRMRGLLEDRRDKAIKLNSIENIVASGAIAEVGQAGELFANEVPGEIIGLVAGLGTMGLGSWALHQQGGGKQRVTLKPNMLAQIFKCPTDKDSEYPPLVWTYLNSLRPGERQTRLQVLYDRWQRFKVIPNLNTPEGIKRIGILTNTRSKGFANIDLYDDQCDMLVDVRSEVFQLDRDLLDLMLNTQDL